MFCMVIFSKKFIGERYIPHRKEVYHDRKGYKARNGMVESEGILL